MNKVNKEIVLGQMGRDVITGYTGLCMAKTQYLTGCHQVLLVARELDKDGKRKEGEWFDDSRITPIGDGPAVTLNMESSTQATRGRKIKVSKPGADESLPPYRS